jgi:hypothetical protein
MGAIPRESFGTSARIFNGGAEDQQDSSSTRGRPSRAANVTPAELGARITLRAIRAYHEAHAFYDQIEADIGDDRALDDWSSAAVEMMVDADAHLLMAILTWPVEGDPFFPSSEMRCKSAIRPRGVVVQGKLYAGIQDPDDDTPLGEKGESSNPMRLTIIPMANVANVEPEGGAL